MTNQKAPAFISRLVTGIKKGRDLMLKTDRTLLVGFLVVALLAMLVASILFKFAYRAQGEEPLDDSMDLPQSLFRHPLTGISVSEFLELPRVFGVMIDNHEDARPISGIDQAFLVIEAPVEAGIPRALAFFTDETLVEKIGPVRSARPYFVDWTAEFDALYVHVGGSNAALDRIASGGTFDLNQYWWGDYFWRSTNRYAPHNVYTSIELLSLFALMREEEGDAPTRLYDVWTFKDSEPSDEQGQLRIDFWSPVYVVDWTYDSESGRYLREQFGEPHVVESGAQIAVDNVAVVITDIEVIDTVGRREIRTIGEGEAYVLQDGHVIEAIWRKPSASERLKFYDRVTGEEIAINAGVTWIEVVESEEDIRIE